MAYYYVALQSKTHAFLLENRLMAERIQCEITYMPRQIMMDLCNLGVKVHENYLQQALQILKNCGLPGIKVYLEIITSDNSSYEKISF